MVRIQYGKGNMSMAEKLSEKELEALTDALEDGFPDMLGRRSSPSKQKRYGTIFSTNPLGEEVLFFSQGEEASLPDGDEELADIFRTDGGIYAEADERRGYFVLNPFGFNSRKLREYFEARVEESPISSGAGPVTLCSRQQSSSFRIGAARVLLLFLRQ